MIFPDVTTEGWLKQNPSLEVMRTECVKCGSMIETTVPCMTSDYVGLRSGPCQNCGHEQNALFAQPVSKKEKELWTEEGAALCRHLLGREWEEER